MGKNDLKRDKRFKRHLAQQLQVEQPPQSYLQAVQDAFDSLPDELPVKARPLRTFGRACATLAACAVLVAAGAFGLNRANPGLMESLPGVGQLFQQLNGTVDLPQETENHSLPTPTPIPQDPSQLEEQQGEERSPGWLEGLLAAGGASVSAGQYERAMALYEEALAEGVQNGQIYNQMGLCQMADEDYEGAGDSFDKGYELASAQAGSSGAEVSEGQDADGQEEPQGNAAASESLVKELAFNRAAVREYMGQYDEALSLFEAYVSAYGEDERAQHEIDFLKTRV